MKTDRELMQDFVEMMRYEVEADKKEKQNADRMNESYFSGIIDADEFIIRSDEFKAMESRLKHSNEVDHARAIDPTNGSHMEQKESLEHYALRRFNFSGVPRIRLSDEQIIKLISDYLEP